MIDSSEQKANLIELDAEARNERLAEQKQQMEDLISQKQGKKREAPPCWMMLICTID